MIASKWYNFHLLFDALYYDRSGLEKAWLTFAFELFMCAATLKLLFRARSLDVRTALRGIAAARTALSQYRRAHSESALMKSRKTDGSTLKE
jgi:hypothetical protein